MKQIMLTPENDEEKQALQMFSPDDNISLEIKNGTLYDSGQKIQGYEVSECQGGYLRAYERVGSVMFVLRPKKKDVCAHENVGMGICLGCGKDA